MIFLRDVADAIVENTDNYTTLEFKKKVFMKVFNVKKGTHDSDLKSEIIILF